LLHATSNLLDVVISKVWSSMENILSQFLIEEHELLNLFPTLLINEALLNRD
jgi:hypothetical protein